MKKILHKAKNTQGGFKEILFLVVMISITLVLIYTSVYPTVTKTAEVSDELGVKMDKLKDAID